MKFAVAPRPYWIASTDIESDILVNSLLVAAGQPLEAFWLPATPVYALGGLIALVGQFDISRAQALLSSGQIVVVILSVITLIGFSGFVRRDLPVLPSLAVLVVYFLLPAGAVYLNYFSENGFIFPIGILALWALWRSVSDDGYPVPRPILVAGILAGLALTIKLVFVSFLIGGIVTQVSESLKLRRTGAVLKEAAWRRTFQGLSTFWLLATSALAATVVWQARSQPPGAWRVVGVLVGLIATAFSLAAPTRSGRARLIDRDDMTGSHCAPVLFTYLSGSLIGVIVGTLSAVQGYSGMLSGLVNLSRRSLDVASWADRFWTNAWLTASRAPVWLAFAGAAIVLLSLTLVRASRQAGSRNRSLGTDLDLARGAPPRMPALSFGIGLVCISLVGIAIAWLSPTFGAAGQHPGVVTRYLLPVAVCLVFCLWVVARFWVQTLPSRGYQLAICLPMIMASWWVCQKDLELHMDVVHDGYRNKEMVDREIANVTQQLDYAPKVLFVGTPRPSVFLRHGDLSYANNRLREQLDHLYPNESASSVGANQLLAAMPEYDVLVVARRVVAGEVLDEMRRMARVKTVRLNHINTLIENLATEFDVVLVNR